MDETRQQVVLAVDLDNTLIATDLLHENILAFVARDPLGAWRLFTHLGPGEGDLKARFKDKLAAEYQLDPALLPYRPEVLELIEAARAEGQKVVLVSASNQELVQQVAAHLGCFDDAVGSTATHNLGGRAKAAYLVERFGAGGFDYVGDGPVDIAVWSEARKVITVGAGPKLRHAVNRLGKPVNHLPRSHGLKPYVKALRPHQWAKNVLLFAPLLSAHRFDPTGWTTALLAFFAFSLTASAVYVINDLLDLPADRAHPRKCNRPFASGRVKLSHGVAMVPLLLILAVILSLAGPPPAFLSVLVFYFAITLTYSLVLKRKLMIDVFTLAGLYTLRILAGAVATSVYLSPWMLAFSVFLFLSLAAIKRQTELVVGLSSGRANLAGRAYSVDDLPIITIMAITAGYLSVLVLALYLNSPDVTRLYESPLMLWGACPILLYWISRLVMLSHRGQMDDDPVVFALKDPVSWVCGLWFLGFVGLGALA